MRLRKQHGHENPSKVTEGKGPQNNPSLCAAALAFRNACTQIHCTTTPSTMDTMKALTDRDCTSRTRSHGRRQRPRPHNPHAVLTQAPIATQDWKSLLQKVRAVDLLQKAIPRKASSNETSHSLPAATVTRRSQWLPVRRRRSRGGSSRFLAAEFHRQSVSCGLEECLSVSHLS
jgi:hypothetical protein